MIDTRPRSVSEEVMSPDAVRLSAVVKRFTDAKGERFHAVDGIDLRITRGEIVAFLGPNGAGKTTTIDMLLGLTRPDEGTVELFGREPQRAVRSGQVAAVLQSGGLLPDLSVEATVRMLGSLHPGADVEAVLVRAGLDGLRHRRVAECSGGEQQRLRFALALLSGPELLVLDEPTAGMDVVARREFWATVREETGRGMTVMFATHYMEEADRFADRVVMIDRGRVVADGSVSQVRSALSGRTVSALLDEQDAAALAGSPLVRACASRGGRYHFDTPDSDALLRLLVAQTSATEIEVTPRSLEEAFMTITQHRRTVEEGAR
ncbi:MULTISPECIES: ATP-binding cassette domain-containing protein [unclassified Streptomyces]|uniref:ABC transporter ATP-binding protein n=1 Tax=unclassified Streptomyces TaxID=2593676 RepID=UPI0016620A6A|nr:MULTISPECIES: ABC transporter ATP-binding protein [unclassified Streptomyces]MBD0838572.1 ABC transporter ATP-binding protein [Streptomyces sp. TRM68416]